jgi:cytoskeleton protein RodZ
MPQNPKEHKSAGLFLRQTREAKNISLEEASKATRIHTNVLKAIESDDLKTFGEVYARSFLRIYAEFLGVNKDEVLGLWAVMASGASPAGRKAVAPARPEPPRMPTPAGEETFDVFAFLKAIPWKAVGIVIASLFLIVVLARIPGCRKKTPSKPKKTAVQKVKPTTTSVVPKPSKDKQPIENKAVVPATPKPATIAPAAAETKIPDAAPVVKKSQEKIVLVVKAKEKVWLQIKVDGKVAFQGVLAKGSAESWQAPEKIEMWVGNAGAVQVELNGQLLGKIGRPGQTLKHVVFTRSGLSIQR